VRGRKERRVGMSNGSNTVREHISYAHCRRIEALLVDRDEGTVSHMEVFVFFSVSVSSAM